MIKNVHAPGSVDFAKELVSLNSRKNVKIYMTLFNSFPEADMLIKAVDAAGAEITAVLYDESLTPAKPVQNLAVFYRNEKYPFVSLSDIEETYNSDGSQEIIIVSSHIPPKQDIVESVLNNLKTDCLLYHVMDIPHSVTVNGQLRIINDVEYLKTWPEHIEILQGEYMTDAEKKRYTEGRYPYQITSKGKYFCLENHNSVLTNISEGYINHGLYREIKGKEKKTVTFLGDSHMVNMTVPVRMSVASMLQQKFMDAEMNIEVKNFSTIANNLQNAYAQIQSIEPGSDDIILCSVFNIGAFFNFLPSSVASPVTEDSDEVIRLKFMLLRKISDYCAERGTEIIFMYFPTIHDVPNMTPLEKKISALYGYEYRPLKSIRKLLNLCIAHGLKIKDFSEEFFCSERKSLFIDETHFSYETSQLVSDIMFEYVNDILKMDSIIENTAGFMEKSMEIHYRFTESVLPSRCEESREYINYLKTVSDGKADNSGIIVMNSNPFTLGHMYLIEEAKKQVDYLYIMVVPEENPFFSFRDRYEMVKNAIKDMDNVELLRSGNVYATRVTFPAYFERDKNPGAKADASGEIYIFCSQIAPALKVKKRFVGSEPKDGVTAQYNRQLAAELPESGIELIEIPRRELDHTAVSASDVRRYLKEKNYSEVKKLVPESTYEYIRNVMGL